MWPLYWLMLRCFYYSLISWLLHSAFEYQKQTRELSAANSALIRSLQWFPYIHTYIFMYAKNTVVFVSTEVYLQAMRNLRHAMETYCGSVWHFTRWNKAKMRVGRLLLFIIVNKINIYKQSSLNQKYSRSDFIIWQNVNFTICFNAKVLHWGLRVCI